MASNNDNLPAYQEKLPFTDITAPRSGSITGPVQTCSIRDNQVNYLTIIRDSAKSYHIALTVDPTPLYRIELTSPSKVGDIQIFSASDSGLPAIAAARLLPLTKSKGQPVATICTYSPALPDALWRPVTRTTSFSFPKYQSDIPVVSVPGRAATPRPLTWKTGGTVEPFFELWWDNPLPLVPTSGFQKDQRGSEYKFATFARKTGEGEDNLLEIRRGGGLDFELSVILELFIILHFNNVELI